MSIIVLGKGEVEDIGNYRSAHRRRVIWDFVGIKK
jgi:hypothetical protein